MSSGNLSVQLLSRSLASAVSRGGFGCLVNDDDVVGVGEDAMNYFGGTYKL